MAGLAGGSFSAPPQAQREFFEHHVAPWMGRFFTDLEQAQAADFYRAAGTLGRVFIQVETGAFALPS
jgi:TorA maturation chaperone TorD